MPYFKKKKTYKKPVKRTQRRRKMRMPRTIRNNNNLTIKQEGLNDQFISNSSIGQQLGSIIFNLSSMLNYSTYTQIYDYYKIHSVLVSFVPVQATQIESSTGTPLLAQAMPYIYTCIDRDDSNTPIDANAVKSYGNSRKYKANRKFSYKFKPSVLTEIYSSPITTAYKITPAPKLDCDYTLVPHYGLKYAFETASPTGNWTYRIDTLYTVTFYNRRK